MASTVVAVGLTIAAAGFAGRYVLQAMKHVEPQVKQVFQSLPKSAFGGGYYRGGFEPKMTKREAALILGVSPTANKGKIRDAHRRIMLLNNHNFEIDFLCGWTMCERFGVLGSSKVLAKRELLCVPLIGWTWYFLEIVFCKRKWEEDRDTVIEGLRRLADYPEYMWFLLYCEGTRFTETKHRISMEVAASKGLPPLKYHLLPRTKGFTTAVQCLRGTVAAIYDVTLNFRGNKNPSLLGILYGKKYEADM